MIDYAALYRQYGDSPRALDWSKDGQEDRFRVLHALPIRSDDSVLDVGCGLGHFRRYLRGKGWTGNYLGLELCGFMRDQAERLAAADRDSSGFMVVDFYNTTAAPDSDVVVASGVVNDGPRRLGALMEFCFSACRKGAAVNALSAAAPRKAPDRNYYDPDEALRAALAITPRATLRHDYRENDFTIYLYKGPRR